MPPAMAGRAIDYAARQVFPLTTFPAGFIVSAEEKPLVTNEEDKAVGELCKQGFLRLTAEGAFEITKDGIRRGIDLLVADGRVDRAGLIQMGDDGRSTVALRRAAIRWLVSRNGSVEGFLIGSFLDHVFGVAGAPGAAPLREKIQ
jgi:hypothetical protein